MKLSYILYLVSYLFILSCNRKQEPFYFSDDEDFIQNNKYLSDTAKLGKLIFFDTTLSEPMGISCATCHSPSAAFADKRRTAFSIGVDENHPTDRHTISIAYNILAPMRKPTMLRGIEETIGGFFWDGRAMLLEAQAFSPLLNANEMNNGTIEKAAEKIRNTSYYPLFKNIFNAKDKEDDQLVMLFTMQALKSFQTSFQVNPYTSKFDYYLQGKVTLSEAEMRGWTLFQDTLKSKCSLCHLSDVSEFTNTIVFTDFSYENIGLPKHPNHLHLPVDSGFALSEFVLNPLEIGRFKTPTLRNVNKTAPYMHNGIFATLEEVLDFYNTRDVDKKWKPEYAETMNMEDLGNLNLTDSEIQDIIAFLKTLDDGYRLK